MLPEELREAERAAHEALLRQFSQTSDRLASAYAGGAPPDTVQTMGPATVEMGMQASPHDLYFREPDLGFAIEHDRQLRVEPLVSPTWGTCNSK